MERIHLADSFFASGNDLSEFQALCSGMDQSTQFLPVNTRDIVLLTYQTSDNDKGLHVFYQHKPGSALPGERIRKAGIREDDPLMQDPRLVGEMLDTRMLLYVGGQAMFVAEDFIGTLASRVRLGGQQIMEPTPWRDAYIAEIFASHPTDCVLVTRRDGDIRKAFAIHSKGYGCIPQAILPQTIEKVAAEMGKCVCRKYNVTHEYTSVLLEFPEKAQEICDTYGIKDMTPGMYLATSDTGNASVTAMAAWINEQGTVSMDSVFRRKHQGSIDAASLMASIEANIFPVYTKLPERLCDLISIDVPVSDRERLYGAVIDAAGLRKLLGKELRQVLIDELTLESSGFSRYTAYDVAQTFLDLPRRLEIRGYDRQTWEAIQLACGRVPYLGVLEKGVPARELFLTA